MAAAFLFPDDGGSSRGLGLTRVRYRSVHGCRLTFGETRMRLTGRTGQVTHVGFEFTRVKG